MKYVEVDVEGRWKWYTMSSIFFRNILYLYMCIVCGIMLCSRSTPRNHEQFFVDMQNARTKHERIDWEKVKIEKGKVKFYTRY